MRTLSKTMRWVALCGWLAFLFCLPGAVAKEKTQVRPELMNAPIKLIPYDVTTNPFAAWGINIAGPISMWNKMIGGPAKQIFVTGVGYKSPADIAGVQLGDEVKEINGSAVGALPTRYLKKNFHSSEKGDSVSMVLLNWATAASPRSVELKLGLDRTWLRKDGSADANCWGLIVSPEKSLRATLHSSRKQRIKEMVPRKSLPGWRPSATEGKGKKKKLLDADKLVPVYVRRRMVVVEWEGRLLTLIERENHVVEVIERGQASERDDVVGQLMHEGATLSLRADGSYELKDALSKAEPVQSPPSGQTATTLPVAVVPQSEADATAAATP